MLISLGQWFILGQIGSTLIPVCAYILLSAKDKVSVGLIVADKYNSKSSIVKYFTGYFY